MTAEPVTVAIPVLNGGALLGETLAAVRRQRVDRELELLVVDSGSTDGSRELAAGEGARLIDVPAGSYSHGGTRNQLMEEAAGSHVAFLTQDAVPADDRWLARLLEGFDLGNDVALVFGPYLPRAGASHMVRRELIEWFGAFAPDEQPRLDRGEAPADDRGTRLRVRFFTDANGCVARRAWEQVPFREVAYAEDRVLARDMLTAGWAKTYHPRAAVVHSHDYPPLRLFRRSFDEWRGLRDAGWEAPAGNPFRVALTVQRHVRDDVSFLRREGAGPGGRAAGALQSLGHHAARQVGAAMGGRAERLPPSIRRLCSLEGRA